MSAVKAVQSARLPLSATANRRPTLPASQCLSSQGRPQAQFADLASKATSPFPGNAKKEAATPDPGRYIYIYICFFFFPLEE